MVSYRDHYPFESRFAELPAGRMHYLDEGPREAPALIMLHGNPTWSFYYRNLIKGLAGRHRVIAPDHLGCGLSDKPQDYAYTLDHHIENLSALVDHLELRSATFVLHDWGGAIGMGLAVRRPELAERFVIFNTAAFPADKMPWAIGLCRVPVFGALAIRGFNAFARGALMSCVVHKERLTPEIEEGYLFPYDSWKNRVANLRFVQDIPTGARHPGYPLLVEIGEGLQRFADHPMLICWGAKDFVFDDWFYGEWKRRFPRAVTHYFVDAGHYVLEDAHERILPHLREFLGESAA